MSSPPAPAARPLAARLTDPPPLLVGLAGLLLFAGCLGYALKRQRWDVSGFVFLGAAMPWADDPAFAAVTRRATPAGYDGQAYYAIARSPWADHRGRIDAPFRQTRVLYPLVCFLATAGHPAALLWAMPLVNLLAVGGLTWAAAGYARRWGRSGWWGLLLPLALNLLVPATRNLTDVFSCAAVFAVLAGWELRGRAGWLAAAGAAAVLAREQNVVVLAVVAVAAVLTRRFAGLVVAATGALTLAGWVLYLRGLYGEWPVPPAGGNFAPPGVGLRHWLDWQSHHGGMRLVRWAYAAFLLGLAAVLGWRLWRDRGPTAPTAVGWVGVAMVGVVGPSITDDYWSYTRTLFLLPLAGWMASVRAGSRAGLAVCLSSVVFVRGTLAVM